MATDFQRIAFRAAFRTAREAAGLTQREVAAKLGCAPSTVAQWDGGVSAPREDMAARLEQLLDAEPGEFRQLLGFAVRDVTIPGVVSFAEAVESDRWLRPDQRQLLNAIHDHIVTANRHADQQARQRAEHLATHDVDPDAAAAAELAQQHAEDEALRRAADDDATPAASVIDPDTSVTYDELPHPTH